MKPDPEISNTTVICIGAGPAGLTAAYLLSKQGLAVTVLERDSLNVGGISRTENYKGFRFDIGGHRFFSKSAAVEQIWTEILGPDLVIRTRKSRIYYRGKFFDYPLRAFDALYKLGFVEAVACVVSYVSARVTRTENPRNFEEWIVNQFGRRLFEIFFRTYTEKVWGMKCTEISADWAAQRIKGLSLGRAIWHAFKPQKHDVLRNSVIKTLIGSFRYPRLGPGMMWEAAKSKVQAHGGIVHLGCDVVKVSLNNLTGKWTVIARDGEGSLHHYTADHVISSTSISELVAGMEPAPSLRMREAAQALKYRDFIVVALIVKDRQAFEDQWLYVHDPAVRVGRIQNIKSWSSEMIPDQDLNCFCLEYFCFEGDDTWSRSDKALITMAGHEMLHLGLIEPHDLRDGFVIRQSKAYPVYDDAYLTHLANIRGEIGQNYPNLHLVGRNGMHKYNNQDHAMMTAMLTVKNIVAGQQIYDVWNVSQDAEYLEAGDTQVGVMEKIEDRLVPSRVSVTKN